MRPGSVKHAELWKGMLTGRRRWLPRSRLEVTVEMNPRKIRLDGMNLIHLAQDISVPGNCENENLLNVCFP